MTGWTVGHDDAPFAPTCGRISPSRLPNGGALESEIGGDYWENTFWPGHSGDCAFGHPAVYNCAFDVNSAWANGKYFSLRNGWNQHVRFRLDDDNVDNNATLTWAMSFLGDVNPDFDPRRVVGGPSADARDTQIGHVAGAGLKPADASSSMS